MGLFSPLSSNFYSIPKATIFFKPTGALIFELLGDADTVEIATEIEETPRFTNECGLRTKVREVVTQLDLTLSMSLAQLSPFNRGLSLLADSVEHTQSADPGHVQVITGGGALGIYELDSAFLSSLSVTDGATTTAYVLNVNYKIDLLGGYIQIILVPGGADDDLEVTYDIDAIVSADAIDKIGIGNNSDIRGAMVIRGTGDVGPNVRLKLHDVQLRPSGARNYIAETDFDIIELEGNIFRDDTQPSGFELGEELLLIIQ